MNSRYDLAGNTLFRLSRHQALARIIPLGNYRGGAGLRCLVALGIVHYLGGPLFNMLIRFERQAAILYRIKQRLVRK